MKLMIKMMHDKQVKKQLYAANLASHTVY